MTAKKKLIVDTLCLDSLFRLITKRAFKRYDEVKYCRITALAKKAIVFLPNKARTRLNQITSSMNSTFIDNLSLSIIHHQLLDELMKNSTLHAKTKFSKLLNTSEQKLEDSFKAYSWNFFRYPSEAVVWARYFNADVLCSSLEPMSNEWNINVYFYQRTIDISKVIPRKGYLLDSAFETKNLLLPIAAHLTNYVVALIVAIFVKNVPQNKIEQKDIAVQVIRNKVNPLAKSDLFWANNDDLHNQTLLIASGNCELINKAKKLAFINISKNVLKHYKTKNHYLLNAKVSKCYLKTFTHYLRMIFLSLRSKKRSTIVFWLNDLYLYKAVFDANQTKVFISNKEYFNDGALFACEMSNVVYTRGTWSTHMRPHTHITLLADVLFSWGKATSYPYRKSSNRISNIIECGYIDGAFIKQCQSSAETEWTTMLFFDNANGFDVSNDPAVIKLCFMLIVELLEKHKKLKVTYKPKSGDFIEIDKANVRDLITPYIKKGRFKVLTGEKSYDHMPVELADKVDLVLGYPISTAATETMIAGVPSFHLNLTGLREHYWEKNGFDEAVFYSIEEAKERLSKYIENPESIPRPSKMLLKTVNHFNDYKAKERMQKYIEFLCEGEGLSVSERVQNANQKYYQLDIVKNVGKAEKQECEGVINAH